MSRAIAAARPSTESAVAAGQLPTRQSRKPRRPKLIDAPRQSKPCQHVDQRQLSLRSAASSHPDCRAVLIQIVAQYFAVGEAVQRVNDACAVGAACQGKNILGLAGEYFDPRVTLFTLVFVVV